MGLSRIKLRHFLVGTYLGILPWMGFVTYLSSNLWNAIISGGEKGFFHNDKYFLSVHGALFWDDCVLTHIPVHPNQLAHRSRFNIHGHLHSKHVRLEAGDIDARYLNVSCEQNNLTPISAYDLFGTFEQVEVRLPSFC